MDTISQHRKKDIFNHFSKKHGFLDLMIINFENATSHKYVVETAKSL